MYHISLTKQKLARISGIMNKLKFFLPKNHLITLYNSLVLPYLNYGILLWGCKAVQLERLQKKLVRIITCSKYNAHLKPLLKKLSFLKATHICALHELKFCFKLEQHSLPVYLLIPCLRNSRILIDIQHDILIIIKHTFMKSSLRYRIPKTFNDTPSIITDKIVLMVSSNM